MRTHNRRGCDRTPPPTLQQIQAELDELVAAGVLEVIVDDNGVERYLRVEDPT